MFMYCPGLLAGTRLGFYLEPQQSHFNISNQSLKCTSEVAEV